MGVRCRAVRRVSSLAWQSLGVVASGAWLSPSVGSDANASAPCVTAYPGDRPGHVVRSVRVVDVLKGSRGSSPSARPSELHHLLSSRLLVVPTEPGARAAGTPPARRSCSVRVVLSCGEPGAGDARAGSECRGAEARPRPRWGLLEEFQHGLRCLVGLREDGDAGLLQNLGPNELTHL